MSMLIEILGTVLGVALFMGCYFILVTGWRPRCLRDEDQG